ncbi:MAG: hypothetical protein GY845_35680 [Planctomycetes bacterium]|nr:hypothetical protein [Planctomycetota bacterium]
MNVKIIVTTIIAYFVGSFLFLGDALTSLVFGIESAFLCCVSMLILNRRKFVKSSPNSMHTLVCILVCIVSVLSVYWINSGGYKYWYPSSSDMSHSSSIGNTGGNIRFGNLWGEYSFDENIVCAIFSVDRPIVTKYSSPDNNWKLTFSDSNSVEFNILKDETVWIDKKHRITFLGEVLNKEDVLFLNNLRHDKELKISSPDELLETVNKLKVEHTALVNPL